MSAVSLLVFAGGRATRLGGTNKALLSVGGRTILDRIVDSLGPLASERLLLANDLALDGTIDARLVFDPEPHAGVLPALANGFAEATGDICIAVACDMPFLSRAVVRHLLDVLEAEKADVAIPRTRDFLEPMHAVYRRQPALSAIRQALARGERRMVSYFSAIRVREVADAELRDLDPDLRTFFNVNTSEDLARAQSLATRTW